MEKIYSLEEIKDLITIATSHDAFDIWSLILTSAVPLAAIILSYISFSRHTHQITQEKLIEKDVEKLYEAVDYFFEYSDIANLYFSLQIKNINSILTGKHLEHSFDAKLESSSEEFFGKIQKIRLSSFLFRALGKEEISEEIDAYREKTINLRKIIFDELIEFHHNKDTARLSIFNKTLETKRKSFETVRNNCLKNISLSKSHSA